MTTSVQLNSRVDQLGRASRRAAVLSLLGFILVLVAIAYAYVGLSALEGKRQALIVDMTRLQRELTNTRADLAKSRGSLASARAAINAFHAGRLEDAVALYDEALASDPENAYLLNLRAYALFQLGRIDAAVDAERRSVAADPDYAWGYFDLARFLYAATPPRLQEAREAEARAIELRPGMRSIMQADGEFQRLRRTRTH